jgi:hypothetical protein
MSTPTPEKLRKPGPNAGLQANVETPAEKRGRGRPKNSDAKVRPAIPADQFSIDVIEDTAVLGSYRRRRTERDEQQLAVDKLILGVHNDWLIKGKPTDWLRMPVRRWIVDKNVEESARFMLRKASALYGYRLIFGREVYVENKAHITFCVTDRKDQEPPKAETPETPEKSEKSEIINGD